MLSSKYSYKNYWTSLVCVPYIVFTLRMQFSLQIKKKKRKAKSKEKISKLKKNRNSTKLRISFLINSNGKNHYIIQFNVCIGKTVPMSMSRSLFSYQCQKTCFHIHDRKPISMLTSEIPFPCLCWKPISLSVSENLFSYSISASVRLFLLFVRKPVFMSVSKMSELESLIPCMCWNLSINVLICIEI